MQIRPKDQQEAATVTMEGVKNVTCRVLFGPKENAPNFAMRQFDLGPGGHTPYHAHPFEHEIIVLKGQIELKHPEGGHILNPGDAAMVLSDETHQFQNTSDTEPATMICLVPVEYQK